MSNFFKQYRSSKKNYKVRVDEFIVKGYDISTIQKLIHREYGIRLKKSSINKIFLKRVDQEKIHKISESDDKTSNLDFINEIGDHQNLKKLFFENFTKGFTSIDKYDSKIRNLIRIVLRDNIITNSEKIFFTNKLKEYKLNVEVLEEVSDYVFSKNPYYDEIFQLIWSDNVIEKNEIDFIHEKVIENSQEKKSINKRFWIFSIKNNYEVLLKFNNFRKIIKLNAINSKVNTDYDDNKVFYFLDIFKKIDDLEIIIENAKDEFEEWTYQNLNKQGLDVQLELLYQRLDIDFKKEFQSEKTIISEGEKIFNSIKINGFYNKKDLYSFFQVPEIQQGGKWNNGYCEHNNKWFIFCNINIQGKGYYDQNFNYSNSFDANGNLNWEGRYGSKIHWDSIIKLSETNPYIFTKENEGDNKWKYNGRGECLNIQDTTPVKILWRIINENISISELPSDNSELLEDDPYKEIFDLSKTNMFEAFESFKKIALKNNPKINPRKIRTQFNELIEELD